MYSTSKKPDGLQTTKIDFQLINKDFEMLIVAEKP
jgi:hypothetical protein